MSVSVRVSRMDSWCEGLGLVAFWEFARGTSPEAVSLLAGGAAALELYEIRGCLPS